MLNPLQADEMLALKELVKRHNFTGLCSALAAICSDWKNAKEIGSDANRRVMITLEMFFEGAASEVKLIMLTEREQADMTCLFEHHTVYLSLGEHLTEPDVAPPNEEQK